MFKVYVTNKKKIQKICNCVLIYNVENAYISNKINKNMVVEFERILEKFLGLFRGRHLAGKRPPWPKIKGM